MAKAYRLFILGDPHIRAEEQSIWEQETIPDINALHPDRVLILGDLTGGYETGTAQGTETSVRIFSNLKAPWHSIIGNHDLQCTDFETDEAAVAMMLEKLGRSQPGWVVEEEFFAIVGLDNTFWRRNAFNKNEIVVDEVQRTWLEQTLQQLGNKPVILLCHTPPVGCGMVMQELHAQVGNAYTNQNQNPSYFTNLVWSHPNILFWFSGHNHLGQHYREALTRRLGILFAHTGTASLSYARDGHRHSRILEIDENEIRIRTFDHGLRAIDPDLDFIDRRSLHSIFEARRQFASKRLVPRDPETMEQPSPASIHRTTRFLFFSDAHSTVPLQPIQQRVAEWGSRLIPELAPDAIIFGGDLTHRSEKVQAEAFLERCRTLGTPAFYLPGNNEGVAFDFPESVQAITQRTRYAESERVWILPTGDMSQMNEVVDAFLAQLPKDGACLVFAHFPPQLLDEERLQRLVNAPCTIHWICGHRHRHTFLSSGNLQVTICAGLDPLKVRDSEPEVLRVDWDGEAPSLRRYPVPLKFLNPPERTPVHYLGLAYRDTTAGLLQFAIEKQVSAIQFHYRFSSGTPTAEELALAEVYRKSIPNTFLSMHLPNFEDPDESVEINDQANALEFALGMRVDDLTMHLPKVENQLLFDSGRNIRTTAWASGCLETYTTIAEQALRGGAQISFENVYNKKRLTSETERLGTRPWHLLRFVEVIRKRLIERGFTAQEAERVGIIFDVGHAFSDATVSKYHGIADWLSQIAPYLQLSHIHQAVEKTEGKGSGHHQVIESPFGAKINYYGFLSALRDVSQRSFPLLLEIRDKKAAWQSYRTLKATGLVL